MESHAILQGLVDLVSYRNSWVYLSFVACLLYMYWRSQTEVKFPPGPIGFPVVGVLPYLSKSPAKVLKKWSLEKYGPIMSVRLGMKKVVVLNTFEVINKAFVKQGSMFSDRPWTYLFCRLADQCGLICKKYDDDFKTQKHFALKYLREKGLGKKELEMQINEEGDKLVEYLKNTHKPGDVINLKKYLFLLTSNVILQTTLGRRYEYADKEFNNVVNTVEMLFSDRKYAKRLRMIFGLSFLARIPPFAEAVRIFDKRLLYITDFLRDRVEEHRKQFDPDNVNDFIDAYLYEQRKSKTTEQSGFSDVQLITLCQDFLLAGSDTTSTTLTWLFVYYLNYPDYQKQINKEIDQILGMSGIPTMSKRRDMPVTCAFIQEVMRIKTLLPLALHHRTSEQVTLKGFVLPKGTTVTANLYGVHMDPETWPDPEKFDPNRHVDDTGKFIFSNKIIPFSIGPRFCLGESLARVEIFIFFVKLLQRFTVRCAHADLPPLDKEIFFTVVAPTLCDIKLEIRS